MKKVIAGLMLLAAGSAQADTLLGVYAGGSAWNMESTGGFSNNTSLTSFDFEKEAQGSFHVALEHFIPLVPNFKIRSTNLKTNGNVTLTSDFVFGDAIFSNTSNLMTDIDFSNTDYILYYEVLDNDIISVDLGLNFKNLDGSIYVANAADATNTTTEDLSGFIPMVYGSTSIGMPFSGFSFFAEGSFLAIEDHSLSDVMMGVEYRFIDNMAIDVAIQAGYRTFKLELEDLDDIYSDLEFKGAFIGAEVHF